MDKLDDNGYIILARYKDEYGNMVNRLTYGPYPSKAAAEKANTEDLNFPTPEHNQIIRLWGAFEEPHESEVEFVTRVRGLIDRITLPENFTIILERDKEIKNGRYYVQIQCFRMDVITKKMGFGVGGKAYLGRYQTDNEIVQTVFGLYKGYAEHEARESFELDGKRIYGPHISIEALLTVAHQVDVRNTKHVKDAQMLPDHDHKPVQHRDGCPPWCETCKLTADFTIPISRLGKQSHNEIAAEGVRFVRDHDF